MNKNRQKTKSQKLKSPQSDHAKAQKILEQFSQAILNVRLNEAFDESVSLITLCKRNGGKLITTGMGKAGIAMRKFSSTLCSLGFPSSYLHPGESAHGDLGILAENDMLFVASTSGKTREVIEIIDLARKVPVSRIIGITSHKDSPIREMADTIIDMGVMEEEGHLHLAPTTSILVMLAITDALALMASESIGFTKEDYALRHHSGYLGACARNETVPEKDKKKGKRAAKTV